MSLESAGDEAVGRAHVVQDFDDWPVGGHGPRVAKVTERMVTARTRPKYRDAAHDGGSRHVAHAFDPVADDRRGSALATVPQRTQRREIGVGPEEPDNDHARDWQIVEDKACTEPRLDELRGFSLRIRSTSATRERPAPVRSPF